MNSFNSLSIPYRYATMSGALIACVLGIAGLRFFDAPSSGNTLIEHGLLDETGHLLTALMIGIGLKAICLPIPVWAVLIGGVLPDVGHILSTRGLMDPIAGSSRSGTHSLVALASVAGVGFIDRRHANVWLGITLGAVTHLWRDMGTGAIPLLWPLLDQLEGTTFRRYLLGVVLASIAMLGSGALLDTYTHRTTKIPNDCGNSNASQKPAPQCGFRSKHNQSGRQNERAL